MIEVNNSVGRFFNQYFAVTLNNKIDYIEFLFSSIYARRNISSYENSVIK